MCIFQIRSVTIVELKRLSGALQIRIKHGFKAFKKNVQEANNQKILSMKKAVLALLIGILFVSCKHKPTESTRNSINIDHGILVENTTIISTNTNGVIEKFVGYVLTDNDNIVYVGVDKPNLTGQYKVIDGHGKFTIPGLIDSHVHLANMAGMTSNHQKKYPTLVQEYYAQLPKSFLYYGYTTLIDVNNYAPNVINDLLNAPIRPDIFTCGNQVQIMNDFMMEMEQYTVEDRLKSPFLYDKYNKNIHIPETVDLEAHTPKSILAAIKRDEGLCVKTLYEDISSGFPQSWELPSLELLNDLVKAAHQEGMPVIMHAPSYNGQRFALEAGVDIIAHTMWNWYDTPEQFLDLKFTQDHKNLLLKIANSGVGYQPTFRAIYGEVDLLEGQFYNDSTLEKIFPKSYLAWLKTEEGNWGKEKIVQRGKLVKAINPTLYKSIRSNFNSDEEMFKGIQKMLKTRMNQVIKLLADNHAKLLLATDNGAMNMATHPPGFNGYLEMNHWFQAGVSLEQIFLAATVNNAKAFRINSQYGTITAGKIANILILNKDPLNDISAYEAIHMVIVHGQEYERKMLSANQIPDSHMN
tara:strand:+ start:76012 stop:77751 length:1740 start_codon:yes stop_codon:yes gene_type:complete